MSRLATLVLLTSGVFLLQPHVNGQPAAPEPRAKVGPDRLVCRLGESQLMSGGTVYTTAFSADETVFATAASDNTVRVWEWPSRKLVKVYSHKNWSGAEQLKVSPDGRYVCGWGGRHGKGDLVLWDTWRTEPLFAEPIPNPYPVADVIALTNNRLAFRAEGNRVKVYDIVKWKWLDTITTERSVLGVGADARGEILVAEVGAEGVGVRVRSVLGGKVDRQIKSEGKVRSYFGPGAEWIGLLTEGSGFSAIALADGKEAIKYQVFPEKFTPVAFSPKGSLGVIELNHETIVWDYATGKGVATLEWPGHREVGPRGAAFVPGGELLAGGFGNGPHAPCFWSVKTGQPVELVAGHRCPVTDVVFLPGDTEVVTAAGLQHDPAVRLWETATGKLVRAAEVHPQGVYRVAVTPDRTQLVAVGHDGGKQIKVLATSTLETLKTHNSFPSVYPGIALSPDGKRLTLLREQNPYFDPKLKQWNQHIIKIDFGVIDLESGKVVAMFDEGGKPIGGGPVDPLAADDVARATASKFRGSGVRVSPGSRVWCMPDGLNKTLTITETASRRPLAVLRTEHAGWGVGFRPDAQVLAYGDDTGNVRFLDVGTGKELAHFSAGKTRVRLIEFSNDGRRVATVCDGDDSNRLAIWDVSDLLKTTPREPLAAGELTTWVKSLRDVEPKLALRAAWELIDRPEAAIAELAAVIDDTRPTDPMRVARLISDLANEDFKTREEATRELTRLGDTIRQPAMDAFYASESPEQRKRLGEILDAIRKTPINPDTLFASRAVFVLERIGSKEAVAALKLAAKRGGILAEEANVALTRLGVTGKK